MKQFLMCRAGRIFTSLLALTTVVSSRLSLAIAMATSTKTTKNPQRIQWVVRPTTADDKEAADALLLQSYSKLLRKDYDEKFLEVAVPDMSHARPELLTSNSWYVVEHPETRKLVGCGGWTPKSPFGEDVPHLRHFATHPDHLRQGVGRAIWDRTWNDYCEYADQSADDGRKDMEVLSTITAESFYASLGFQKIKDIVVPIREDCPFPAVLMRRPNP